MAKRAYYDIDKVLSSIEGFWYSECRRDPKKFTYPNIATHLNRNGIGYNANNLKHIQKVTELVQRLKSDRGDTPEETEDQEKEELRQKCEQLQAILFEIFPRKICIQMLKKEGIVIDEEYPADPEACKSYTLDATKSVFNEETVKKMSAAATKLKGGKKK